MSITSPQPWPRTLPDLSAPEGGAASILDEILGVSPAVVYLTSAQPPYPIEYISANAERFLGIDAATLRAQGGWFKLVHPEDLPPTLERFEHWLQSSTSRDLPRRYRIRTRESDYIWVEDTCRKVFEQDRVAHIAGAVLDVTEQVQNEESLRRIAEAAPGVIYQFERRPDGSTRAPYASRKLWEIYGVDPETLKDEGESFFDLVHPEDLAALTASIEASERDLTPWSENWRVVVRGQTRWVEGQATPRRTDSGGTLWHGLLLDITRQKHLEEQLRAMSVTDPLTVLFNRRYLVEVMQQELGRFQRTGRPFSLIMMDLDHFKSINDRFGHSRGDEVLRQVADLLRKHHRSSDVAARLGGEEFALLLPETQLTAALQVAETIRRAISELTLSDGQGHPLPITASLGVTEVLPGIRTVDQLLERADKALYRAKRRGRNQVADDHQGRLF